MAKNVEVVENEDQNVQVTVEAKKTFKEKVADFKETKVGKALGTAGKVALGAALAVGALVGVDAIKSKKDSEYYDLDALTGDTTDSSQDQ